MSMIIDNRLKPCPICGAKAFVMHDVVDGFEFGWSVGCPRYCNDDGIHGHDENTPEEIRLTGFSFISKEQAIKAWNDRVESGKWKATRWGYVMPKEEENAMKITFDVPYRTNAVVITILVDKFSEMQMRTTTVATGALKEGARFDMISDKLPKEGDSE